MSLSDKQAILRFARNHSACPEGIKWFNKFRTARAAYTEATNPDPKDPETQHYWGWLLGEIFGHRPLRLDSCICGVSADEIRDLFSFEETIRSIRLKRGGV